MQKSSRTPVEATTPNVEAMWGMSEPAIDAMTKTYELWWSQANRLRDEALRFTRERMNKEFEAAAQLGRCTNPTDALAVQVDFANTMAADYLTVSKRMVDLVSEIAKEASAENGSRKAQH